MPAAVVRLHHPQAFRPIDIDSDATACRELQRVLGDEVRHGRKMHRIAAKAGVADSTVRKILYGDTQSPKIRTCILIFFALGWKLQLVPA